MSGFALALVLTAAGLHAVWNAMVKSAGDRAVVIAAVACAHAVLGSALALVAPPPAIESWAYIVASSLIHYAYYALIFIAYRFGDLSQVYPISRGLAPALVALGAYLLIGEKLPTVALLGLGAVSVGVGLLAFQKGRLPAEPKAISAAVATGVLIASYSVIDGVGIRLSNSPFGYIGWIFLLEFPVVLFVAGRRLRARAAIERKTVLLGISGGVLAVFAYGLVLYAKTIAPLGAVSAVRESSVIIAALIGVVLFGERPWRGRIISAVVVAAGVVALASAA